MTISQTIKKDCGTFQPLFSINIAKDIENNTTLNKYHPSIKKITEKQG